MTLKARLFYHFIFLHLRLADLVRAEVVCDHLNNLFGVGVHEGLALVSHGGGEQRAGRLEEVPDLVLVVFLFQGCNSIFKVFIFKAVSTELEKQNFGFLRD